MNKKKTETKYKADNGFDVTEKVFSLSFSLPFLLYFC